MNTIDSELPEGVVAIRRYIGHLRAQGTLAPNSICSYEYDLLAVNARLMSHGVHLLLATTEDVTADIERLKHTGAKPGSIYHYVSSMRTFFNFLVDDGIVSQNPLTPIRMSKERAPLRPLLTKKELKEILDAPNTSKPIGVRDSLLLHFLAMTDITPSPLATIKLVDIDLTSCQVNVSGRKGEISTVLLGETLLKMTRVYLLDHRIELEGPEISRYLFPGRQGSPLRRQTIWHTMKKYAKKVSISQEIRASDLRNSYRATHDTR